MMAVHPLQLASSVTLDTWMMRLEGHFIGVSIGLTAVEGDPRAHGVRTPWMPFLGIALIVQLFRSHRL